MPFDQQGIDAKVFQGATSIENREWTQEIVQVSGAKVDCPGKGHDRFLVGTTHSGGIHGVLDGAGTASYAELALQYFKESQGIILSSALRRLGSLTVRDTATATAALVQPCTTKNADQLLLRLFLAGDASILLTSRDDDLEPRILAHEPTSYVSVHGSAYIDTERFLGPHRRFESLQTQVTNYKIAKTGSWVLLACTDGVYDGDRGLSLDQIQQTVREVASVESIPAAILETLQQPCDDAAVVAIGPSSYSFGG